MNLEFLYGTFELDFEYEKKFKTFSFYFYFLTESKAL